MSVDLGKNADHVFASFVRCLAVSLRHNRYDLILAGGDSGAAMASFTRLVYEQLNLRVPPVVLLPIYRAENATPKQQAKQDQTLQSLAKQEQDNSRPRRILFVDDEIFAGNTLRIALHALNIADGGLPNATCTVVAEDCGFHLKSLDGIKLDFQPFSTQQNGIANAIFWFIPYEYEQPVKAALAQLESANKGTDKFPMNILLNAPIKTRTNDIPTFSYETHQQVKRLLPHLDELQQKFQAYLRHKISAELETSRLPE